MASRANTIAVASLGQLRYISLMNQVDVVVGNSSSGVLEAPSLNVPTVDIGDRQKGRERAASVFNAAPERSCDRCGYLQCVACAAASPRSALMATANRASALRT